MSSLSQLNGPAPKTPKTYQRTQGTELLLIALICIIFVAFFLLWEGHKGFSLMDESYLWYGVQRVIAGEVPIRDFQSYDPGRYYWCALFLELTKTRGIMAIRYAASVMELCALFTAIVSLISMTSARQKRGLIILAIAILVTWMVPRHKLFDIAMSIGLVFTQARLIQSPGKANYLFAGLMVGFAAYIGRNHGVYGISASALTFFYLGTQCTHWQAWRKGILLYAAGVLLGFLPMLITMVLAKGFMSAFINSVKFIFAVKSTNLPLPVPWPWKHGVVKLSSLDHWRYIATGSFFILLPVFGALCSTIAFIKRWTGRPISPLVVSCAFCAIPYAHYAYSRADVAHLAQGSFPTLIGILALLANWRLRWSLPAAIALLAMSLLITTPLHPGWQCTQASTCEHARIGNDLLWVDHATASDISLLQDLRSHFTRRGQNFYVMPFMPGAYSLFNARSPTWEIYTAWPRDAAFQQEEITRLSHAAPGFILITDEALDGRDTLRFQHTHPLIYQYILQNYLPLKGYSANPSYRIFVPRADRAPPII